MIYYSILLLVMLIMRLLLAKTVLAKTAGVSIIRPVYSALYFIPVLVLTQALFGGILCKLRPRCHNSTLS